MHTFLLYIDPGSGSFLVQAIIGGVLAVGVFFKSVRYRIAAMFGRRKADDGQNSGS